jgi:hypothetical protein
VEHDDTASAFRSAREPEAACASRDPASAAAGDTPQKAADNLAGAIRTLTGRKDVFPIEIRQQHDRYACMRCSVSQVHVFSDKDEAKKHTEARKAEQGWINNV